MQADDGDEEEVYTDSSTFLKVSVIDVLDSDKWIMMVQSQRYQFDLLK